MALGYGLTKIPLHRGIGGRERKDKKVNQEQIMALIMGTLRAKCFIDLVAKHITAKTALLSLQREKMLLLQGTDLVEFANHKEYWSVIDRIGGNRF